MTDLGSINSFFDEDERREQEEARAKNAVTLGEAKPVAKEPIDTPAAPAPANDYDKVFAQQDAEDTAAEQPAEQEDPTTPQKPDPYAEAFEQQDAEDAAMLRESLRLGRAVNPDEAAKAAALAKQTGLPADTVERNMGEVEEKAAGEAFDPVAFYKDNPATAGWLRDPANAKLAHDDVQNLSDAERTIAAFKRGDIIGGLWGLGGMTGTLGSLARISLLNTVPVSVVGHEYERGRRLHKLGIAGAGAQAAGGSPQSMAAVARAEESLQKMGKPPEEGLSSWLGSAAEVVGQMLAGFESPRVAIMTGAGAGTGAALGAFGGPLAPITSTAGAGIGAAAGFVSHMVTDVYLVEGGLSYIELRKDKVDPGTATALSHVVGVANAALEMTGTALVAKPFIKLSKRLLKPAAADVVKRPTVRAAAADFAKAYALGVGGEVATEVMQEVNNILAVELGKSLSGIDSTLTSEQVADRLSEIAVKTFKAMALLGPIGPGANFSMDYRAARKATHQQEVFKSLANTAQASKLRERLPDKYKEFVAAVLKENGGSVTDVYIDTEAAVIFFQPDGEVWNSLDADEKAIIQKNLNEAQEAGNDTAVPLDLYAARIAGTEAHEAVARDIKFNANDMTPNEADRFNNEVLDIVETETNEARKVADVMDELRSVEDRIGERIREQSVAAGHSPTVALQHAGMARAHARVLKERFGVDPEDYYGKLSIRKELPAGLQPENVADMDALIDGARDVAVNPDEDAILDAQVVALGRELERRGLDIATLSNEEIKAVFREDDQAGGQTILDQFQADRHDAFYSAVEQAVAGITQEKGTKHQFRQMIAKTAGVTQEEMAFIGLDDFLAEDGAVTKDEILKFVRENKVEIKEITKRDEKPLTPQQDVAEVPSAVDDLLLDLGRHPEDHDLGSAADADADMISEILSERGIPYKSVTGQPGELVIEFDDAPEVRFVNGAIEGRETPDSGTLHSEHTLPGGENYREFLVTMPLSPDTFMDGHFEEKNIIFHVRMNDRIGPNGERILFIEEIQSDIHQTGRKYGYRSNKTITDLPDGHVVRWDDRGNQYQVYRADNSTLISASGDTEGAARQAGIDYYNKLEKDGKTPNFPLKKTWHEAAFRRVAHMAATEGYDSIAWTPGEVQADRYDLSKKISKVTLIESSGGVGAVRGAFSSGRVAAYGHNGAEVMNEYVSSEEDIAGLVGKEAAERLLAQEGKAENNAGVGQRARSLEGLDLQVGGEGMKSFYDKMVKNYASKFGKKFGAKVGVIGIDTDTEFEAKPQRRVLDDNTFDVAEKIAAARGLEWDDLSGDQRLKLADEAINMSDAELEGLGVPARPDRIDGGQSVWTLPVTAKMRAAVDQGGFPLFQAAIRKEIATAKADLEAAVKRRMAGEITQHEFDLQVSLLSPVLPYEYVPDPATDAEMRGALKAGQIPRVGLGSEHIGEAVGLRLDIPAFTNHGVWVPTIHTPKGKPIAHDSTAHISAATFTLPGDTAERKASRIGAGEAYKSPFAQINGTLESVDVDDLVERAKMAMDDLAWTQVGYDPRRHTFFYDRETQKPVLSADEVIQIGPLVLAKNAEFGDGQEFLYQAARQPLDTLTPEFQKWFRDSKVVDENGKPLRMFHGTTGDIEQFDPAHIRVTDYDAPFNGFWFSDDTRTSPAMRDPTNIMPVYLSMKNPATFEDWSRVVDTVRAEGTEGIREKSRSTDDEVRYRLQEAGFDGIYFDAPVRLTDAEKAQYEETGSVKIRDVSGRRMELRKGQIDERVQGTQDMDFDKVVFDSPTRSAVAGIGNTTEFVRDVVNLSGDLQGADLKEAFAVFAGEKDKGTYTIDGKEYAIWREKGTVPVEGLHFTGKKIDVVDLYTPSVGHVTSYSDIADFEGALKETTIVVFEPNQIKSTFNKKPTQDPRILNQDAIAQPSAGGLNDHLLHVERGNRHTGDRVTWHEGERDRIAASAAEYGIPAKTIEDYVRRRKLAHPAAGGWTPWVYNKTEIVEKTDANGDPIPGEMRYDHQAVGQAYTFNLNADGKAIKKGTPEYQKRVDALAQKVHDEVLGIYRRSLDTKDTAALTIIRQSGWYKNMRVSLRRTFGGIGDLFADLLGATSPNTPVRGNWANAEMALKQASRGDFDQMLPEWRAWAEEIETVQGEFRQWVSSELTTRGAAAAEKIATLKVTIDERVEALKKERVPLEAAIKARQKAQVDSLIDAALEADPKANKKGVRAAANADPSVVAIKDEIADLRARAKEDPVLVKAKADIKAARSSASKKAVKESAGWAKRKAAMQAARELPEALTPLKPNGKKFGFNGRNVVKAMLGLWRVVKNADADISLGGTKPKALNFSGNLIGFREGATIDVWAARLLQRIAKGTRIPSEAEGAVKGDMLETGETTSQFGMGQAVFAAAAKLIRGNTEMSKDKDLSAMNDDDLQAVVWFLEKERWASDDTTSSSGEGGSFEFEAELAGVADRGKVTELRKIIDSTKSTKAARQTAATELDGIKRELDRFYVGLSIETSEDTQGIAFTPNDAEMRVVSEELTTAIHEGGAEEVIGAKAWSSEGRYGDIERAFDVEVAATEAYDVGALMNKVVDIGRRAKQDSVFVSRVLRPTEEVDYLKHRPGIEVYFRDMSALAELQPILDDLAQKGLSFYTVITDAKRTAEAQSGAMPSAVGVRLQYVPEFDARYPEYAEHDLSGDLSDADISDIMRKQAAAYEDMADRITAEVDGVTFAGKFWHETNVQFLHEYEGGQDGNAAGRSDRGEGSADQEVWQGRTVREGVGAANLQREAGEPGNAPDGQSQEDITLEQDTRNTDGTAEKRGKATTTLEQSSWHGGPKQWLPEPGFPHGRPRLDFIGAGEGHTAFGWGFYSADRPGIGREYKEKLSSKGGAVTYKGRDVNYTVNTPTRDAFFDILDMMGGKTGGHILSLEAAKARSIARLEVERGKHESGSKDSAKDFARIASEQLEYVEEAIEIVSQLEEGDLKAADEGVLYNIDLPDADVAKFLDWDKPLSEQPQNVIDALDALPQEIWDAIDTHLKKRWGQNPMSGDRETYTGGEFHDAIIHWEVQESLPIEVPGSSYVQGVNEKEHGALWLKSIGIPGLKYYDGVSRNPGASGSPTNALDIMLRSRMRSRRINSLKTDIASGGGQQDVMKRELASLEAERAKHEETLRTRNYVTWDQDVLDRAALLERNGEALDILRQQEGDVDGEGKPPPKGQIAYFPNGDAVITMFEAADLSTFLHESGHFYVRVLEDLAKKGNAIAQADLKNMMDFVGAKDGTEFASTENQEKLARAFEAYLREGKAPSVELRSTFAKFRSWLVLLYKNVLNLDITLDNNIRGVFDRLLATDEEIQEAEMLNKHEVQQGVVEIMTESEITDYRTAHTKATDAAIDELELRKIVEEARETKRWWKSALAAMQKEVTEEVDSQPVYKALAMMRDKSGDNRLSTEALVEEYGEETVKRLPKGVPPIHKKGGTDPEVVAELAGFTSADEMIAELMNAQPRKKLIDAETLTRMKQRHGDLQENMRQAAEAAQEIVYSDERGLFLETEMKALARKAGDKPTPAKAAEAAAQRIIAERKVDEAIKPGHFAAMSAKAGREAAIAVIKKDFPAANDAKRRQMINHYLYLESVKARDEVDKGLRSFNKFMGTKKKVKTRDGAIDPEYVGKIQTILSAFQFRPRPSARTILFRNLRQLNEWAQERSESDFTLLEIPGEITLAGDETHYRDLTLEEFRGLKETIDHIAKQGRLKGKLIAKKKKRELDATVKGLNDSISENWRKEEKEPSASRTTFWKQIDTWKVKYSLRKIEFFLRELDGFKPGLMQDTLFRPLSDATNDLEDRRSKVATRFREIFSVFTARESKQLFNKKIWIPEIGDSYTKGSILAAALNVGNEGNRSFLLDGYGWSEDQLKAVLGHMNKRDWDFVQSVWDFIEEFNAETKALDMETRGYEATQVEPIPVETPYGTYRGGYYPRSYNSRLGKRAKEISAENAFDLMTSAGMGRPTTNQGRSQERVAKVKDMVLFLDLDVLMRHIDETQHDLAFRKVALDLSKIMNHRDFQKKMRDTVGPEKLEILESWMKESIVKDLVTEKSAFDLVAGPLRRKTAFMTMGYKVSTMALQPLGYTQTAARLISDTGSVSRGLGYAIRGVTSFYGSPAKIQKNIEWIYERSPKMMVSRARTFDRDIHQNLNQLKKGPIISAYEASLLVGIGKMQMLVDLPTWMASHSFGIDSGMTDEAASEYANSVVRMTQSSGLNVDMAAIQRGSDTQGLLTMYMTFFSAMHSMVVDEFKLTHREGFRRTHIFMTNMLLLTFLPANLFPVIFSAFGVGGPDKDENYLWWMTKNWLTFGMAGLPFIRDMMSTAVGGFPYRISPVAGMLKTALTLPEQIKQGEGDAALARAALTAVSLLPGFPALPVSQIMISGQSIHDVFWEGKPFNWIEMFVQRDYRKNK